MSSGLKKALLAFALFSALLLLLCLPALLLFDSAEITARLNALAESGKLCFFAAAALAAAVSVPRQFIALAAGMAYGWLGGLALCSLAVLAGNSAQFAVSRGLLRPFLRKSFSEKSAWLDKAANLGPFRMVLMLRLLPAGHSGLINMAAGASSISALPFLSASYLGQLPQNAIFALAGSGFRVDPLLRFSLAATLFICSLGLGLWLYKRYKTPATCSGAAGSI